MTATTASTDAYYVHDGMVLSTGDVLVARIPGEIETATRVALAVAEALNARHAEVEQLRGAIEKHRVRKQDRTAIHEQPGKYGCLDVDLRLWSVLDRED